jgi:D-beta-D-heptose 7-phosphate kinase/D-beta-D-heptose 1-phosphate adenosyltransferase
MKKVWINGCFDIVHRGHIELFQYAKELGDYLVVGIDSDKRVKQMKGSSRPINNQNDRKYFLESIQYIDKVVIFEKEQDLVSSIKLYSPDVMVIGSDYKGKKVIGSEYAKKLLFFDRVGGYSTTNLIDKKTYVFDLDGTLCTNTYGDYNKAKPIKERINIVNDLYNKGNEIIILTARGMGRFKNSKALAMAEFYELTRNQLNEWGVKYNQLFLGKPAGDIYIDDKGEKDEDFFNTGN